MPLSYGITCRRQTFHFAFREHSHSSSIDVTIAYTSPLCLEHFDEFDPFLQTSDDLHRLEDLLAAEAQRKWLQGAITGKTALIKDLKKVTRQHMKIANLLAAQSPSEQIGIFAKPSDDLLYAMDIQDIDDLYLLTDSVFRDFCGGKPNSASVEGSAEMQTEETGWSIIRPKGSGSVVEVCMKQETSYLKRPSAGSELAANRFNDVLQSIIQEHSQEITNGAKSVEHMLAGVAA
ncbi:hypothetical protein PHYPSEUDO_012738 [Phytophthora pseudosyringae]|uniref:Uncharacterized protein n=1 Tax=Phytophthora pseudosyringae TaxID=221518 RepID=A0A8T1V750_9STRA|nr:hypothetical protein PHYPSEUDO_012738 [Phytophthora pseudosyringae]